MKPPGRFTLFRSVIGQLSTNQNTKLKPIIPWSPAFSRLKCSLLVSLWPLIGSLEFPFGFLLWLCDTQSKSALDHWSEYNKAHEQWHINPHTKINYFLKAHFHPWCRARCDPTSCNAKFFSGYWKPSKIVFLKSHPGHTINCFTVDIFTVRYFKIFLQYCEFCRVESEENIFQVSRLDLYVLYVYGRRKGQRSNFFTL